MENEVFGGRICDKTDCIKGWKNGRRKGGCSERRESSEFFMGRGESPRSGQRIFPFPAFWAVFACFRGFFPLFLLPAASLAVFITVYRHIARMFYGVAPCPVFGRRPDA